MLELIPKRLSIPLNSHPKNDAGNIERQSFRCWLPFWSPLLDWFLLLLFLFATCFLGPLGVPPLDQIWPPWGTLSRICLTLKRLQEQMCSKCQRSQSSISIFRNWIPSTIPSKNKLGFKKKYSQSIRTQSCFTLGKKTTHKSGILSL